MDFGWFFRQKIEKNWYPAPCGPFGPHRGHLGPVLGSKLVVFDSMLGCFLTVRHEVGLPAESLSKRL